MFTSIRRPSVLAARMKRTKQEMGIKFDDSSGSFPSYATSDQIRGYVELKLEKDAAVQDLMILLEGQSKTYTDEIANTKTTVERTTGEQTFLRLSRPIDAVSLPEGGIAKAGVSYTIPFTFGVPERLLPYICSHQVETNVVKEMHEQLPPSLGERSCTYDGHYLMDDFAPDMAKITYSVCAKIARALPHERTDWIEKRETIRIVPARSEEPPMDVDSSSADYTLVRHESLKSGVFESGKQGMLSAKTSQPSSLQQPHPRNSSNVPVTSMTTVNLRFDPVNMDDQPPRLERIVCTLKICTSFSDSPRTRIVEPHQSSNGSDMQGMYFRSLELSSRNLSTVSWTQESSSSGSSSLPAASVRLSSQTTSTTTPISDNYKKSPSFTASLVVPISLPTATNSGYQYTFPPTFQSCLVSRIYVVELDIMYYASGPNIGVSHMILKVPVQIGAEGATPLGPLTVPEEVSIANIDHQFHFDGSTSEEPETTSPSYEELLASQLSHTNLESSAPPAYRTYASGSRTDELSVSSLADYVEGYPDMELQESLPTSTRRKTVSRKSLAQLAVFALTGVDIAP